MTQRFLPVLVSALLSGLLFASTAAQAQALRKPSAYDSGAGSPVDASGSRNAPASLPALASRADFDRVARIFDPASAMPHVLFVVDRQSKNARLHFINTPRYMLHDRFLRAKGLLKGDREALNRNYREPGRRFILGTLSWQPTLNGYSYEFW